MIQRGVLDDLAVFTVVAHERSFTRAAARLGMSTSNLSYTVQRLEDRLGIRLLQRTSRSVAPTEAGQQLLARLDPALVYIDEALNDLGRDRGRVAGAVRLTMTRQAYEAVIRPVLPVFTARHPDARVEVLIEYEFRDIVAWGLDAGIRLGEKLEQDMIALKVGPDLRMVAVASPDYLRDRNAPETPSDLGQHCCIGYRMRPGGDVVAWEFANGGREIGVKVQGPLVVNEPEIALDAALDGLGIAYVMERQAEPWVKQGRLIRLLDGWLPPFPGFFLYHPSVRGVSPTLRELISALQRTSDRSPGAELL